jgi:DNA-binding FadR family transcriptional regulator
MSDQVAAELERRIVVGDLRPGEHLPTESELGALLKVSRSVVRDAMRTLEARGLIEVRQGFGMIVSPPSDRPFGQALVTLLMRSDLRMHDVVEAREALERQLAALAAQRGDAEDWQRLEEILERFEDAVDREAWDEATDAHVAFHAAMIGAIHLPALEIILEPLQAIVLVSSIPAGPMDAELWEVWAHREVLDALKTGDAEAASSAMSRHFRAMERDVYAKMRAERVRESAAVQKLLFDMVPTDGRGGVDAADPKR